MNNSITFVSVISTSIIELILFTPLTKHLSSVTIKIWTYLWCNPNFWGSILSDKINFFLRVKNINIFNGCHIEGYLQPFVYLISLVDLPQSVWTLSSSCSTNLLSSVHFKPGFLMVAASWLCWHNLVWSFYSVFQKSFDSFISVGSNFCSFVG